MVTGFFMLADDRVAGAGRQADVFLTGVAGAQLAAGGVAQIGLDGFWEAQFLTAYTDSAAINVAAFVVPSTYVVPLEPFYGSLPAEIFNTSVARAAIVRHPSEPLLRRSPPILVAACGLPQACGE